MVVIQAVHVPAAIPPGPPFRWPLPARPLADLPGGSLARRDRRWPERSLPG